MHATSEVHQNLNEYSGFVAVIVTEASNDRLSITLSLLRRVYHSVFVWPLSRIIDAENDTQKALCLRIVPRSLSISTMVPAETRPGQPDSSHQASSYGGWSVEPSTHFASVKFQLPTPIHTSSDSHRTHKFGLMDCSLGWRYSLEQTASQASTAKSAMFHGYSAI